MHIRPLLGIIKLQYHWSSAGLTTFRNSFKFQFFKMSTNCTEIQEFYRNRCVFLTGGTGFMGKGKNKLKNCGALMLLEIVHSSVFGEAVAVHRCEMCIFSDKTQKG